MGKRRFRNRIKSMVGGLIDIDKDEELKGSNIETEDNYKKIIELVNEDDQQDKNKLVGLLEEFHNRYQSIYERYDNITGKLKEKVRSKKEKEKDSSSSSSSDSDDSSNKNGSKNGKLENQIDMVTDSLKEELQAANIEIDELKRKLKVETEEKIVLKSQVTETEEMFNELKLQSDGLHEENSKLLAENRDLSLKLENFTVVESELYRKIEDINRENTGLIMEKETALTTIEELRAIIVELKGEKKDLESELVGLKCEFSEMKDKLQTTEEEISILFQKLENAELENKTLSVECSQLREQLAEKENELSMQTEMNESFKNEAESKMSGIREELESLRFQKTEIEKQKEDEILALQENLNNLQRELESLHIQVNDKQLELESIIIQKLESENLIKCLKEEITNMNSDQERLLGEKEIHRSLIKELENKIEEMSNEIQSGHQSKEQIVDQLEETIEDLKSDLEMRGDEINTLTETVRNLEVKIRLANQKLRVTEQMLNETEHDHATKEEKLHQENKTLMDKMSTLSQTITAIKQEVQEKVHETLTGIDSLNVKFEEDYGHLTTRVYEIRNEIQAAQIQVKHMNEDTKQKTEEMVTKLKVSAGENASLMKSLENMKIGIVKKDEKIGELENTILMKEEWISGFGEDKREAIKQLCIWADYHRDRYDHLQELLLKTTPGSRRQTVS
uniref:COP1-interactive protein 1-like n=1 Tax=Erigeron canadensis TaxID=72917 RepID=UPI001CB98293|nr:COP1-interactive protein 1-like [Erigeron canadensis]XP_043628683.1 COP1-interactive protein 1-like [Erigeron canadensis]